MLGIRWGEANNKQVEEKANIYEEEQEEQEEQKEQEDTEDE